LGLGVGVRVGSCAVLRGRWIRGGDPLEVEVSVGEAVVGRAIGPDLDGELVTRSDAAGRTLGDLEPSVGEADGEVTTDGPGEGLGEEGLEVGLLREAAVRVANFRGLDGEALVPVGDVNLFQEAVALLEGRDALDAELLDQAILRCAEVALDAALGLRRVSQDETDVEFAQRSADDGLCPLDVTLLQGDPGHGPGPLAEVTGLVGVKGHRASPAPQVVDGDLAVGCPVVAGKEAGHEQPIRGIVVHLDECEELWPPVLEPGML
jgi:hypothetical protein